MDQQQNNREPGQSNGEETGPESCEVENETLQAERDQLKSALQRAQADLVNYRSRAEAERNDLLKYANNRLLARFLPILDELTMALDQAPKSGTPESLVEGFRLISRKLHSLLELEGVKQIEAQGKCFDPSEHEALAQQESVDCEDGHVLIVVRQGYRLHDRVLRPAQVIVAKNSAQSAIKSVTENSTEKKEEQI